MCVVPRFDDNGFSVSINSRCAEQCSAVLRLSASLLIGAERSGASQHAAQCNGRLHDDRMTTITTRSAAAVSAVMLH